MAVDFYYTERIGIVNILIFTILSTGILKNDWIASYTISNTIDFGSYRTHYNHLLTIIFPIAITAALWYTKGDERKKFKTKQLDLTELVVWKTSRVNYPSPKGNGLVTAQS